MLVSSEAARFSNFRTGREASHSSNLNQSASSRTTPDDVTVLVGGFLGEQFVAGVVGCALARWACLAAADPCVGLPCVACDVQIDTDYRPRCCHG
jgi:hypothetical protein